MRGGDASERGSGDAWRSLRIRNFRLYFISQAISQAGTFMQGVAQAWLVLELGGDGTVLGLTTGLQFFPLVILGLFAGSAVDRVDRRRFYLATQLLSGATALALGLLTVFDVVELPMVLGFAFVLGLITAADLPAKQALVYDLVPPRAIPNAVGLVTSQGQIGRVLGPALAGVTIGAFGIGTCFLLNAASFGAVIVALVLMRPSEMQQRDIPARRGGEVREIGTALRRDGHLLGALVMGVMLVGLAWGGLDVAVPLLASRTFAGGASLYGLLASSLGVGAVVGALGVSRLDAVTTTQTRNWCLAAALSFALLAAMPSPLLAAFGLVVIGAVAGAAVTMLSVRLRMSVPAAMQGRVAALWVIAAVGTRPIGGPIVGLAADQLGVRWSVALLAVLAALAPLVDARIRSRRPRRGPSLATGQVQVGEGR